MCFGTVSVGCERSNHAAPVAAQNTTRGSRWRWYGAVRLVLMVAPVEVLAIARQRFIAEDFLPGPVEGRGVSRKPAERARRGRSRAAVAKGEIQETTRPPGGPGEPVQAGEAEQGCDPAPAATEVEDRPGQPRSHIQRDGRPFAPRPATIVKDS